MHQNMPDQEDLQKYMDKHAFFWQFFVPGAKGYLNKTLNGNFALVNSAPITLHSLSVDDCHELERIQTLTTGENKLPFGSEIEIQEPLSINVIIDESLDGKDITPKRNEQLKQLMEFSLDASKLILPITKDMGKGENKHHTFYYTTNNKEFPISKVSTKDIFPFDLSFAMTVHKAQGRTIDKVVLDLTEYPNALGRHSYSAIFVALSRVRNAKDIRLLPNNISKQAPHKVYNYMTKLCPDSYSMAFYHGFQYIDEHTQIWSPELALQYKPT
jgi:hypothetical protein